MANLGLTGAPRDWIRVGLRAYPYGKHCAYFRVTDSEFRVVRVVHGACDVTAIIFDTQDGEAPRMV